MLNPDSEGRFLAGAIESLAREQSALAGSLADPEKAACFDNLLNARQRCMEQIDDIDKYLTRINSNVNTKDNDSEIVSKIKKTLEHIQELDKDIYTAIFNNRNGIKSQITDLSHRKKSISSYNANILARKSMIMDKSR
ncbi:MAG: hypothetical protein A4E53_00078 [Pelotomaculum sp. PtaB.Bin104]|nr:MAG: hypothetical protein A4E53_00078 [Pelotomaculum sp. PtaB.Bin104]